MVVPFWLSDHARALVIHSTCYCMASLCYLADTILMLVVWLHAVVGQEYNDLNKLIAGTYDDVGGH